MNEDLLEIIYNFTPSYEKYKLNFVSKFLNSLYKKDIEIKCIKIQNFYKKNSLNKNYINDPSERVGEYYVPEYNIWNRKFLYRFYILEYPEEHLFNYPNFLVNKLYRNSNSQRAKQLRNWIDNNENTMKKSYVNRFFRENNITSKEIIITGW
jgi:hypothetical protein